MERKRALPLHGTSQQLLKVIHVLFAGIWLGALASLVLLSAGERLPGGRVAFGLDLAAYRIHEVVLFFAFLGTLVTGLLFSLFTKWGFFKHHWITTKWVLALALFAMTLWGQSPAISGVVALSDAGLEQLSGLRYVDFRVTSFRFALAQLSIVLIVFAISVIKPWGRRRREFRVNRALLLSGFAILSAGAVAFSILGYVNLAQYRNLDIADIGASAAPDGHYRGEADCGFVYVVEVQVQSRSITAIDVIENRDAHYARLAEAVTSRMIAAQTPRVDAITGATTTSKCLMRAAENALTRAASR